MAEEQQQQVLIDQAMKKLLEYQTIHKPQHSIQSSLIKSAPRTKTMLESTYRHLFPDLDPRDSTTRNLELAQKYREKGNALLERKYDLMDQISSNMEEIERLMQGLISSCRLFSCLHRHRPRRVRARAH